MINIKTSQSLAKGINLFLILLIFCVGTSKAQDFNFSGPVSLSKKLAAHSISNGDKYTAIDYYEYYLSKKSKDNIRFKLAKLYFETRDYKKAKDTFEEIIKNNPNRFPLSLYYHAQILKTEGNYNLAQEEFQKFYKQYKNGAESKKYKKLTKLAIKGCELYQSLSDSIIKVQIKTLDPSINSPHIEQSPYLIEEGKLIYTTYDIHNLDYFNNKEELAKPKRKIAIAVKENNKWVASSENLCVDSSFHFANGSLSLDKKRFYFNRCALNYSGKSICHIFVSKYKNGKLQKAKALPEHVNLKNVNLNMPTVTFDKEKNKEIIYFSSDMPKSRGGMDIWYVTYDQKRKKYSKPKNLGKNINTVGNEISPFIDQNTGALYFSSDGLPGIGNLDIFKSYGAYKKWMIAQNIGLPINSGYDELYYSVNTDNKTGFFTSNRPIGNSLRGESCCDDIFEYNYAAKFNLNLRGKLFIENTDDSYLLLQKFLGQFDERRMLKNTDLSLYIIDPVSNDTIYLSSKSPNEDGIFNVILEQNKKYKVSISNSKINPKTFIIDTKDKDPNINDIIDLGSVGIEALPSENIKVNIFYDFGSSKLNTISKTSMDTLVTVLKKIKTIGLEVRSHTDGKGSESFNQSFSEKRAKNIIDYLYAKGIDKSRLKAIGLGESEPIAPNTNPDGSDNPEGRKKNRRTEIRFTKEINQKTD